MAMLRREGRRLLPLMNPKPAGAVRSGLLSELGVTSAMGEVTVRRIGSDQRGSVCRELSPIGASSISTQVVRTRMKGVRNIQKMTKAMKMVTASKLHSV
ncbi:hypothetical protein QJS10_CPA05g01705 [Acorus calamus]|uniref:Uncharacterized protein n=1 Tax=Acorus calamus TaxID=4465 RepID=A0AAV9EUX6_ACOCL|nr:hypothetical protein QJS10_CPA05g01705 [Acorus calamus]